MVALTRIGVLARRALDSGQLKAEEDGGEKL